MKYLEGSKFTIHVGSPAYSEGWDRIFKGQSAVPADESPHAGNCACQGCFGCEHAHAAGIRCSCICHAFDDHSSANAD